MITRFIPNFLLLLLLASLFCGKIFAAQFMVEDIRIDGLQRISTGTVLNYLPLQEGDTFDTADTPYIIRTLYETGFFQYVELQREDNVLIIVVMERPTIGEINVSGHRDIPAEALNKVLRDMGLVRGNTFQRAMLEQLQQELQNEYNERGKYNAHVDASVEPLDQNRVAVNIEISEGRPAKIKSIRIIGNTAFSDRELIDQLSLSTKGLFTFFTGSDVYSRERLDASLESLRSFYLDKGYINFAIESAQVSLSPDKKDVYIDIKIDEGPLYFFSGYQVSGDPMLSDELYADLIDIEPGEIYSRNKVTFAVERISNALGDLGYGFPQIEPQPTIDEAEQTIFINFHVDPGKYVYVRRINFRGNVKTADYVLRSAMRQTEGSLLTLRKVRESERQLRVLGYLENVSVENEPVPGTNNQVDLTFNVTEAPSAEALASVGYGTDGFEFNAAFNQYNFLGTGQTVGVNFNTSRWGRTYAANYYDPYYTATGVGRGFSFYYQTLTPEKLDLSSYTTDRWGIDMDYNFLLSDTSSISAGLGYEYREITSLGTRPATQIVDFVKNNGSTFHQVRLRGGWSDNRYNRYPFPTEGLYQQVSTSIALPASSSSLSFYTVRYLARYYQPLFGDWVLTLKGSAGYGNQFNGNGLPFYENYYAGGIAEPGMIRGFDSYSLGPKDSNFDPIGGNILVAGSAGVILPWPFSQGALRTTAFLDAGNVYSDSLPLAQQATVNPGPVRYSLGVSLEWRSPFGPLEFSLAQPMNRQPGDDIQPFQFTISSGF